MNAAARSIGPRAVLFICSVSWNYDGADERHYIQNVDRHVPKPQQTVYGRG